MMQNNLFVKKLIVYTTDGRIAYDETFHKGINIIRGDNSSGKSTITHLIFYVLGGDFTDFIPQVKYCSHVMAEIEANGHVFTVKRYIQVKLDNENIEIIKGEEPLYFFWDTLEKSLNPPEDVIWYKFGYKTLPSKKSFSNVLFEKLGLPIIKEENSNITFHQILRLLYIDQESPTSSLFLYEQFDSQIKRETVSDLLLGVYNEELYDKKKRKVEAEKELEGFKREIKTTERFFSDPLSLNPSHLKSSIANKINNIRIIDEQIANFNLSSHRDVNDKQKLEFEELNQQSILQRKKIIDLEDEIKKYEYEIEDSKYFIETLKKKIHALTNSIHTREYIGGLPLEFCPECLKPIIFIEGTSNCKLCKEPFDEDFGISQALKMEQEISFQIKESENLLKLKERHLLQISANFEAEYIILNRIQTQVDTTYRDVRTTNEEAKSKLYLEKGFMEGEILQLSTLLENAELYQKLLNLKNDLDQELKAINYFIYKAEHDQDKLKATIYDKIREEGVYFLNNDLDRQDDFKFAKDFFIDFRNNIAFLSNKYAKYSASSNFYLKIAARFALFLASLSIENMRFPRFLLADNMEDKGIEPKRAQNLQNILIDRLKMFNQSSFQIIYTTSYITAELNKSEYCVGPYYTKSAPTLRNIPK